MLRKDKNNVINTVSESVLPDSDSVAILTEVAVTMDSLIADTYHEFDTAVSDNIVTLDNDEN